MKLNSNNNTNNNRSGVTFYGCWTISHANIFIRISRTFSLSVLSFVQSKPTLNQTSSIEWYKEICCKWIHHNANHVLAQFEILNKYKLYWRLLYWKLIRLTIHCDLYRYRHSDFYQKYHHNFVYLANQSENIFGDFNELVMINIFDWHFVAVSS